MYNQTECIEELDFILSKVDNDQNEQFECEGLSYIISSLLTLADVKHELYIGSVTEPSTGVVVVPHVWVTFQSYVVDYRLRSWLGNRSTTPHGIFIPCTLTYYPIQRIESPDGFFDDLTRRLHLEISSWKDAFIKATQL